MSATDYALWGIIVHLVCDWLLQNHWQANNKASLSHPAAWIHSGIHTIGLLLVFPPLVALIIGLLHLFIDTRIPLNWWRRVYRQTRIMPIPIDTIARMVATQAHNNIALHVSMWGDQVLHIAVIAVAALLVGGGLS